MASAEAFEAESAELLLPRAHGSGHYEADTRPRRDVPWAATFLASVGLVAAGGVAAVLKRDPLFDVHSSKEWLDDASHCLPHDRKLMEDDQPGGDKDDATMALFGIVAGGWLASIVFGILYVHLLKRRPAVAVWVSIGSIIGALILTSVSSFAVKGGMYSGIIFAAVAALYILFARNRVHDLKICGELLKISSHGLSANPFLSIVGLLSTVVTTVFGAAMIGLMYAAVMNGEVVPSTAPDAVSPCAWAIHPAAGVYIFLSFCVMSWMFSLAQQINIFTIAGSISQWYFAPNGTSTKGTTLRALGHALGPSFGSLSLSSLVLCAVNAARNTLDYLRRRSLFCALCSWPIQLLLTVLEKLTNFSTIRMAMSGEQFMSASKDVCTLLARHGLSTINLWWLPGFVLKTFAFVASLVWAAALTCLVLLVAPKADPSTTAAVAIIACLPCFVVLLYVANVMLSIADTVFICWVMDLDQKKVTKLEVHEIFAIVPLSKPGMAVENPDGTYAYAPDSAVPLQEQPSAQYAPPPAVVNAAARNGPNNV